MSESKCRARESHSRGNVWKSTHWIACQSHWYVEICRPGEVKIVSLQLPGIKWDNGTINEFKASCAQKKKQRRKRRRRRKCLFGQLRCLIWGEYKTMLQSQAIKSLKRGWRPQCLLDVHHTQSVRRSLSLPNISWQTAWVRIYAQKLK